MKRKKKSHGSIKTQKPSSSDHISPLGVNTGLKEKWILTACVMVNTSQPVEWTGMRREDSSFFSCVLLFTLVSSS